MHVLFSFFLFLFFFFFGTNPAILLISANQKRVRFCKIALYWLDEYKFAFIEILQSRPLIWESSREGHHDRNRARKVP